MLGLYWDNGKENGNYYLGSWFRFLLLCIFSLGMLKQQLAGGSAISATLQLTGLNSIAILGYKIGLSRDNSQELIL